MSKVDLSTLKEHAEEFFAKAVAGQPTIIEQNGKRAVLLPCDGESPDFLLDGDMDRLLQARVQTPGQPPTEQDWTLLQADVLGK